MRSDQLARQWRIIRAIEASPNGLTAAELGQREVNSLRTIYRDLEDLQEAGFPFVPEKVEKANRWVLAETYKTKTPPHFFLTELMSLYLYQGWVKVLKGTPYYHSLESLFQKIHSNLRPQTLAYLEQIQSIFHEGFKTPKEYGRFREILNQATGAALERRRIEMTYQPLQKKEKLLQKVDPYKVWFQDGAMYLVGFGHAQGEVRLFVLERIKKLRVTDERFEIPADFNLTEFLRPSSKMMHEDLYTVRVRVSPAGARRVKEKIWHETQRTQHLLDGSLEVTFHVAGLEEVKQWILSFGPEAFVLEPGKLQAVVRNDLRKSLALYAGLRQPQKSILRSRPEKT